MFSSLKVRNFRLYWVGMLISLVGSSIQTVAQSWLIFQLTDSAFLLGLVGFLGSIPIFLLSLFGGVAADRINKKVILLFTQNAFMALAFILAILTQFKLITPAQIMVIAVLNGVVMAFDAPTRQAVVVELAGKQYLFNAIALNSAAFNSARVIGPALASILIAGAGMSGCFYINGISFIAVIIALLLIRNNAAPRLPTHINITKDLTQGLKFIKNNRVILGLISLVAVVSLFGTSYLILMPVFANNVLKVGIKGLGMLMTFAGLGALLAALLLARLGDLKHKGRTILISSAILSLSLILFSLSRVYLFCLCMLVVTGWSMVTSVSLVNTSLQILVPDEFRGRVMSVFMFTFAGIMPFGNLIAGCLAQAWGVSLTVLLSGIICMLSFIAIHAFFPDIRKI
jgi:MFS family permease